MALSTPVAKGSASDKASGPTLTISSQSIALGRSLGVYIGYDNAQGAPTSVKFGKRDLVERKKKANGGTSRTLALWTAPHIKHANTRDIVATWSSAIGVRVMAAFEFAEAGAIDVDNSAEQDASTTPGTGGAVTTTEDDTLHVAGFLAVGPTTDEAAEANLGHTLLTRVGTAGAPAISNLTLQLTHEILAAAGDCRATLTATTERDWANIIAAFVERQRFTIKSVAQPHSDINQRLDHVLTICTDESGKQFLLDPYLDPVTFDAMSDSEYKDYVRAGCARYVQRSLDDGSNVDEDSARDTRMAGFVDDTVKL